jgi:hypothetical protein
MGITLPLLNDTVLTLHIVDDRKNNECEAADGVRMGRGSQGTQRKPASGLLCPPQVPCDLT